MTLNMMEKKSAVIVTAAEKQIVRWNTAGHAPSSALPVAGAKKLSVVIAMEPVGGSLGSVEILYLSSQSLVNEFFIKAFR